MARNSVRFLLGNELREIREPAPDVTVLNYLRLDERRCGTKEGCAEGDCGACTVVIGQLDGERLRYRAVNACIQFVAALDGCQLLTVEDLSAGRDGLHPVQQALVKHHATQCGFCTPGFVMSMFALYHQPGKPGSRDIDDQLAGNLCRCTGYGSIVTAAKQVCAAQPADQFAEHERLIVGQLKQLSGDGSLRLRGQSGTYEAPESLAELSSAVLENHDATIVAGGTDVGLWVTKKHQRLTHIISLAKVKDLKSIQCHDGKLEVGAGVTYSEALPVLAEYIPELANLLMRIGSTQIRNAGTLGGNIANGSPIGDMPPALIALGATLQLRRGDHARHVPLEAFFIAYGKQDLQPGEFVESLLIPLPERGAHFFVYKISKRFEQDISAVCAAFYLRLSSGSDRRVQQLRMAFGGMAGIPARALQTEAKLVGERWNESSVALAAEALEQDFEPLTDMRASREYRMQVSKNLLRRAFLETESPGKTLTLERSRSQSL